MKLNYFWYRRKIGEIIDERERETQKIQTLLFGFECCEGCNYVCEIGTWRVGIGLYWRNSEFRL